MPAFLAAAGVACPQCCILVDSTPCNVQALTDEHKTDAESHHFAIGWEVQQGTCKKRAGVGTLQGCVSRRTLKVCTLSCPLLCSGANAGATELPGPHPTGPLRWTIQHRQPEVGHRCTFPVAAQLCLRVEQSQLLPVGAQHDATPNSDDYYRLASVPGGSDAGPA